MKNYKSIAIAVLLAVFILTLGASYTLRKLRFDYEFEDYFPKGDTEYAYYNQFREVFGSDNDFVLISLGNESGIFDSSFLSRVDSFAQALKKVEYVETVITPTQIGYPVKGPFGMSEIKWIHVNQPQRLAQDSTKIFESGELLSTLIATDAKSLNVVLNTTYGLSKVKSDEAVANIDAVIAEYSFDKVQTAGRIYGQRYYVNKMQYELLFFTSISLLIVVIILALAFRAVWGVVIPLLVVGVSVVWLMALMTLMNKSFDLMSSLLPTIMFVVGMSDVVHIISRYLEELRKTADKLMALKISFTQIGKATFLTSITTAIGFLSLYTSGITPVRDFGFFTATGVMLAFIITFLVLPSVLYLLPRPRISTVQSEDLFWNKALREVFKLVVSKSKWIFGLGIGVILISLIGISRVEVNNFLLEDLSENDPLRANFEFFETHYSGARPFEVVVSKKDSASLLNYADIVAIDRIETILKNEFGIKGFVSLNSVIKTMRRAIHGGKLDEYKVPQSEKEWETLRAQIGKFQKMGKLKMVLNSAGNATRISTQVNDYGGKVFKEKYAKNREAFAEILTNSNLDLRYTGMAYLIDKNNETLASSLMYGLLIAFGSVALLMGGIFKSVKMVIITLVPNVIPLLVIGGFMGFTGIDLKVSTSIIFTIAFGIAVDDTIHYVSKLKMELDKGRTMLYALKRASLSTGKAIVLTSLILVSGFFALVFSDFSSTYYIGLLVSITLLFAVLADLVFLPVLIILFYRER